MDIALGQVFVIEYHLAGAAAGRLSSLFARPPAPESPHMTGDIFERSGIIKTVLL